MTDLTKPGVYPGLTHETYWDIDAINHTVLSKLEHSALHAYTERVRPRVPTDALVIGDAIHAYSLEPDRFEEQYVKGLVGEDGEPLPRRKHVDKAAHEAHALEHKGKDVIHPRDWENIIWERRELEKHPAAMELLNSSPHTELTILWEDEGTGLLCKARYDGLSPGMIWDLKSTQDASVASWRRSVPRYNYDTQAAFYALGAKTLTGQEYGFTWIALEKTAPYGCQLHQLDENALWQAGLTVRRWLDQYADCLDSGVWPGYPTDVAIHELPIWRQRFHEENEDG